MGEGTHNEISGGVFFGAVLQGEQITAHLPVPVIPALSGLPSRSPGFTGRDEVLDALLAELDPASAPGFGGPACAIAGLAGVGKTELAAQAAHVALGNGWFPGGVLFTDLYGYDEARRVEPGKALDGLLRALGMPAEHIPPETQDRARLYTSVLATFAEQGQRILVVLDNASSASQVRPLLPTDEKTGVVVTSRHTLATLNALLIELEILRPPDAVELLELAVRRGHGTEDPRFFEERGEAAQVVKWCGYLPLALRIVAALLAENPTRPLAKMSADLAREHSRLDELRYEELSVRAAFHLSYRQLNREQSQVFRLLPVNPGPDLATEAAVALAGGEERVAHRVLESLARAHLVQHDAERWRMHDLVRVYASELADPSDAPAHEVALDRLLSYYLKIVGEADATMRALHGDSHFHKATEALAWLDMEQANLVAAVTSAAQRATGDRIRSFLVTALASGLDAYLRRRRRFDDAAAVAQSALAMVRQEPDLREEQILDQLGLTQWELGRADEAISTYDRAAEIRQQRPPPFTDSAADSVLRFRMYEEAKADNNRGLALRSMGRPEEAADAFVRAVALFERSGHQLQAGLALGNLGLTMMDVGHYEGAVTALEQDVAICREHGDRHSEGAALNSLGTALMLNRRFGDAIAAHQEAASIFCECDDHHHEGAALNSLGIALQQAQRYDVAIAAHQLAAELLQETGDPQSAAQALATLAAAHKKRYRPG